MTPTRQLDNGIIERVSPVSDETVKASGYRFTCGGCGWQSPIMRYNAGAEAWADEHQCPSSEPPAAA